VEFRLESTLRPEITAKFGGCKNDVEAISEPKCKIEESLACFKLRYTEELKKEVKF
jgi:hypothetical protein